MAGKARDVMTSEATFVKEDETILAQWPDDCAYEGRTVQECEDWIMAVIHRKTFRRWFTLTTTTSPRRARSDRAETSAMFTT